MIRYSPSKHVAGHMHVRELAQDVIAVVAVEHLAEEVRVGHPLLGGVAGELLDPRADVEGALGVEALDIGDKRQLLDHALIPGPAPRRACPPPRGGRSHPGPRPRCATGCRRRPAGWSRRPSATWTSPLGRTIRNSELVSPVPPAAAAAKSSEKGFTVVGMNEVEQRLAAAVELARREPMDGLELRARTGPVGLHGPTRTSPCARPPSRARSCSSPVQASLLRRASPDSPRRTRVPTPRLGRQRTPMPALSAGGGRRLTPPAYEP